MRVDLIWLFVSVFLGACGQILLKFGVNQLGSINMGKTEIIQTLFRIFTNVWIDVGIICFVTSMVLWIKVISTMELNKAYPTVSLSYIIVFIFSVVLFHESVSMDKVVGLVLVSAGVYFLNM